MTYVYLFYGLAFFVLALAVAIVPKEGTALPLARNLPFLVAFGLLHGAQEWIDLAVLLDGPEIPVAPMRAVFGPASYVALYIYGIRQLLPERPLLWTPFPMLWIVAALLSHDTVTALSAYGRYFLLTPGALSAAWSLYRHPRVSESGAVLPSTLVATAGFALYAIVAGLIPSEENYGFLIGARRFFDLVGLPVQVFRAVAAGLTALGLVWALRAFSVVHQQELTNHREHLSELVHERTAELREALEEVKRLRGLLPICSWCHNIRTDDGEWQRLEQYISERSEASFTHGICPTCANRLTTEQPPAAS